jgi:hypothetical protein
VEGCGAMNRRSTPAFGFNTVVLALTFAAVNAARG